MVSFGALWLPIILSAVAVFIVSSVLHMALKYHSTDFIKLPNEDAVRAAIRAANAEPRTYIFPYAGGMKEMQTPEMKQKYVEGPVGVLTLRPSGEVSMGPSLAQWFLFSVLVSALVAYVAAHALPPGADFRQVFRIVGTVAWLAYAAGHIPDTIWWGKPWSITMKDVLDGLLYGLTTAAVFAWLWPR
jgi:hypothetical protein